MTSARRKPVKGFSSLLALTCFAALALSLVLAAPSGADSGTWERAWGKNVNGGGVFGICTSAPTCMAGQLGGLGGEVDPADVATDSLGNVYVADFSGHRIQKFDSSGTWERAWGKDVINNGAGNTGFEICTVASACKTGIVSGAFFADGGEISGLLGVATDSLGNVYVASTNIGRIDKFDSSGNFLRAWGEDVIEAGQSGDTGTGYEICTVAAACKSGNPSGLGGSLEAPEGVDTDALGNVYVAEGRRIQKFDSSGIWERAWGKDAITNGAGNTGFEICIVLLACKFGAIGGLGGEMSVPFDVATDSLGNVYVADPAAGRIQKFNSSGTWERAWGRDVVNNGAGNTGPEICTVAIDCKLAGGGVDAPGGAMAPQGVATDSLGTVYVADNFFNRVQEFDSSGNFQRAWGRSVNGGNEWGICTVAANCQSGTQSGVVGEFGTGCELNAPLGLGTDSLGNVYVADTNHSRVQKFVQDPLVPPATAFNCGLSGPVDPPVDPPVAPPVTPTTPQTTAAATPGTASLEAARGCVRRKLDVTVSGSEISKVTFSVNGDRRAVDNSAPFSAEIKTRSLSTGSHNLTADVTFSAASNTPDSTLKRKLVRCRAARPKFTG